VLVVPLDREKSVSFFPMREENHVFFPVAGITLTPTPTPLNQTKMNRK